MSGKAKVVDGIHYRSVATPDGAEAWEIDWAATEADLASDARRRDLYVALNTRVLTDAEVKLVETYGAALNVDPAMPYDKDQKATELKGAWKRQFDLQAKAAAR